MISDSDLFGTALTRLTTLTTPTALTSNITDYNLHTSFCANFSAEMCIFVTVVMDLLPFVFNFC